MSNYIAVFAKRIFVETYCTSYSLFRVVFFFLIGELVSKVYFRFAPKTVRTSSLG